MEVVDRTKDVGAWGIDMPRDEDYVESLWERGVRLLWPAFPDIGGNDIELLTTAARWFVRYIVSYDHLIDHDDDELDDSARLPAYAFESMRAYQAMFELDHPFWLDFQMNVGRFMRQTRNELGWRTTRRLPTIEEAVAWAEARGGLAKISVAGLYHLDGHGRSENRHRAERLTDSFAVVTQVIDDVFDWNDDWKRHAPSVLLAAAFSDDQGGDDRGTNVFDRADPSLAVYRRGLPAVLDIADEHVIIGRRAARELHCEGWSDAFDRLESRVRMLRRELLTGRAIRSARAAIDLEASRSHLTRVQQEPIRTALLRLHDDIAGRSQGFKQVVVSEDSDTFVCDVYLRAMAANTVADAVGPDSRTWPLLESEADYLEGSARPEPGAWSYSPDDPSMPCDVDTFAEVALFLSFMDRTDKVVQWLSEMEESWFGEFAVGPPNIWVAGDASGTARRSWIDRHSPALGEESGFANLLRLIARHFPDRFASLAEELASVLVSIQRPAGDWRSRRFATPYYPTLVAVSALREWSGGGSDVVARSLALADNRVRCRPQPLEPCVVDAALKVTIAAMNDRIDGVEDDVDVVREYALTGCGRADTLLLVEGSRPSSDIPYSGFEWGSQAVTNMLCVRALNELTST